MKNPYQDEYLIFNNQFKLITEDNEFRMSLWVKGFGINDANDNVVMPLMSSFNLDHCEEAGNVLKVKFKIYPNGGKHYEVEIDPFNKTFVYNGETIALKKFAETFPK